MPPKPGVSTEAEILQASARLFCREGYGQTSTHRIAREARVSQASLYHYFAGKQEILLTLLLRTVRPSLEFAEQLTAARGDESAARLVWKLCAFDARLLAGGEENIGLLYFLPEVANEAFVDFHTERDRLFDVYRSLITAATGTSATDAERLTWFVFGLVESVIVQRARVREPIEPGLVDALADAALRIIEAPSAARSHES